MPLSLVYDTAPSLDLSVFANRLTVSSEFSEIDLNRNDWK